MRAKKPYHKRKPSRLQIAQLCAEARPGDGEDPRYDRPEDARKPPGRKALQLCDQVRRALEYALAAECGDPVLSELSVLRVEPAPTSGRLMVTLQLQAEAGGPKVADVIEHLGRAAGKLRCEVAAAIHRRKTPELAFCIVPR